MSKLSKIAVGFTTENKDPQELKRELPGSVQQQQGLVVFVCVTWIIIIMMYPAPTAAAPP